NSARNGGGILGQGMSLVFYDCTISGNSATTSGGGIENRSGRARLIGTIVALNVTTGASPAPSDIPGATSVLGLYNLIGTGGSGGIMNGVDGNIVGVSDPDLGPLGFYGGPTQTMALLPGSAAIGRGTPSSSIPTDQRGLIRG